MNSLYARNASVLRFGWCLFLLMAALPAMGELRVFPNPFLPGQHVLVWDEVFDEAATPNEEEESVTFVFEVFVPDFLTDEWMAVAVLESSQPVADLLLPLNGQEPPPVLGIQATAFAPDGAILASEFGIPELPPPSEWWKLPGVCNQLLMWLQELRELCDARDCDALHAALLAAEAAMNDAETDMQEARARRLDAASRLPGLQKRNGDLNRRLDAAKDALAAAQDAIIKFIEGSTNPPWPPGESGFTFDQPAVGDYVVGMPYPGITVYLPATPGTSPNAITYWNGGRFSNWLRGKLPASATQALREALDDAKAEIEALEAELDQNEADLQAALAESHQQTPEETHYRDQLAAHEAALAAYQECLREREYYCGALAAVLRQLERCERLRAIAAKLREAREAAERAGRAKRDGDYFIGGIPEGVRGGPTPAGERAREAQNDGEEAVDKSGRSREAIGEAEDLLEGDPSDDQLDEAEEAAERARGLAREAEEAAERARRKAEEAREEYYRELQAENERRLRIWEAHRKQLREWQIRRRACIDYLLEEVNESIDGQLSFEELEQLRVAIEELAQWGKDLGEAIGIWRDLQRQPGAFDAEMKKLQDRLLAIMGPLSALMDKISGLQSFFNSLANIKAQLDVIAAGGEGAQGAAANFGAWLELVSEGLGFTIGSVPILEFLTGYFDVLLQSFLAAVQGINQLEREEYERRINEVLGRRNCPTVIGGLVQAGSFDAYVDKAAADFSPQPLPSERWDQANFRAAVRARLGAALRRCCAGQLAETPPALSYDSWILASPAGSGTFQLLGNEVFLPVSTDGPFDNPSGDGIPNFVKYFLDQDTAEPGFIPLAIERIRDAEGVERLALVIERLRGAVDTGFTLEYASTLDDPGAWTPIVAQVNFFPDSEETTETLHILALPDEPLPEPLFLRLRFDWLGDPE